MQRLYRIQQELKAPKGQYNSFGKYKYRSCEDILEAVKPLLAEHGFVLLLNDEILSLGTRFYIKATASIVDSEGKTIAQTSALAREEETKKGMDGSQITGAASSYARKYALNGLFAIDDNKDSDTTNTQSKEQKTKSTPSPRGEGRGEVSTNLQTPTNEDLEIYQTLSNIDDIEDVKSYYELNKELVTDRKTFHKLAMDRVNKIKTLGG